MKVLCRNISARQFIRAIFIFRARSLRAKTIRDTEQKGIAIIHQELALVKQMTVLEKPVSRQRVGPLWGDGLRQHVPALPAHAGAGQAGG
ncbi:Xylose import ATP-binding protein XylG [Serratia fonticola]|uniref:Xylose import ATP-binding protein XylG n=1 Tax=Serratia fonticola TaxID=47917 RepID=A0A4U9VQB0_SERFO|nr:Xylose import ATP-binding protein XylG [Serratia fonticola]